MSKSTVKITFISDGFKKILCSDGVKSLVEEAGKKIQAEANAGIKEESEGFSSNTWMGGYGGGRWVNSVTTTDGASMAAESEEKVLTKAVHG